MQMLRRILICILFVMLLQSVLCSRESLFCSGAEEVTLYVDGEALEMDVAPQNIRGRIMVPLRAIFEAFDMQVAWDGAAKTILGTNAQDQIWLQVGNPKALVRSQVQSMDVPPMIINGRTMVPARFVAESIGAVVEWSGSSQSVSISRINNLQELLDTSNSIMLNSIGDVVSFDIELDPTRRVKPYSKLVMTTEKIDNLAWASLYYSEDRNFTRYYYADLTAALHNGDTQFVLSAENFKPSSGSVQWEQIRYMRIGMQSMDGKSCSVAVNNIQTYGHWTDPRSGMAEQYENSDKEIFASLPETAAEYKELIQMQDQGYEVFPGRSSDVIALSEAAPLHHYIGFSMTAENSKAFTSVTLQLSDSDAFSRSISVELSKSLQEGQNSWIFHRSDFSGSSNAALWSGIRYARLTAKGTGSDPLIVNSPALVTYDAHPLCTVWFDDGWKNNLTEAYPIMTQRTRPIPGEISIVPTMIDTVPYLTEEDLVFLNDSGWALVNHSHFHQDLTTVPLVELPNDIIGGIRYLHGLNGSENAYHFAVPYSSVNDQVEDQIRKYSILSRHIPEQFNKIPADRYDVAYKEVRNSTRPETVFAWIDEAIREDYWLVLMFHKISDSQSERYTYPVSSFRKIIDYLDEKSAEIEVLTSAEALHRMGYPPAK